VSVGLIVIFAIPPFDYAHPSVVGGP